MTLATRCIEAFLEFIVSVRVISKEMTGYG